MVYARGVTRMNQKENSTLFPRTLRYAASASALTLVTALSASAQYATLSLQSQPGDPVGQGRSSQITYLPGPSSFSPAQVRRTEPDGSPGELLFILGNVTSSNDTNTFALLFFGTDQLGIPLQPGTYTDAQRADDAASGHPGLDVEFQNRGCNTLTGNFKVTEFSYTMTAPNTFVIDTFDASFEQHYAGITPALFGQFSYRGAGSPPPAVPEAPSVVSLGLLLALGLGGAAVAARRKKAAG